MLASLMVSEVVAPRRKSWSSTTPNCDVGPLVADLELEVYGECLVDAERSASFPNRFETQLLNGNNIRPGQHVGQDIDAAAICCCGSDAESLCICDGDGGIWDNGAACICYCTIENAAGLLSGE